MKAKTKTKEANSNIAYVVDFSESLIIEFEPGYTIGSGEQSRSLNFKEAGTIIKFYRDDYTVKLQSGEIYIFHQNEIRAMLLDKKQKGK